MPLISETFATADDLDAFAQNDKVAEELLPKIIRRLVLASVETATEIDFPTGKSVNEGGWDGHVICSKGSLFVPQGISGWELTARSDKGAKADEDYEARSKLVTPAEQSTTTFIHWNIRKWRDRGKWASARPAGNKWAAVKACDAKDLETWLIANPGLHLWVSHLIGKRPYGVQDIVSFWEGWSRTPDNPLPPEVVTKGYEPQQQALVQALQENAAVIGLQWEKRELAVAFIAAVLATTTDPSVEKLATRCVYVKTEDAFDQLVEQYHDLILIPAFTPSQLGLARQNGHSVILVLGRDAERPGEIVLRGRRPSELFEAMESWEPNEDKRRMFAEKATRKFTSFYRSLVPAGATDPPSWSVADNVPFLLLGQWDGTYLGDKASLEAISGKSFGAENDRAISLSKTQDALFHQVGALISVVDIEDGWTYLGRHVNDQHLKTFENTILTVFAEVDPKYEIEDPKKAAEVGMFANRQGMLEYSLTLSQGLAQTLCYLGANGEEVNVSGERRGDTVALIVVRRLFEQASTWQAFCSIAPWFREMAEASPDEFLTAIEREVKSTPDKIRALFREGNDSFFLTSSSPHTTLLWALELLAWSPDNFTQTALLLARLAKLDPGGKMANRPAASLKQLFLTWHPSTYASAEHRANALRAIASFDDEIGWGLVSELLPQGQSIAMPTAGAKYRPWGSLWQVPMTYGEVWEGIDGVTKLAVELAGTLVGRWAILLRKAGDLRDAGFAHLHDGLSGLVSKSLTESDRDLLSEAIRKVVAQHKSHPESAWVMSPERLQALESILAQLSPSLPSRKWQWVFTDHAIFEIGPGDDFTAKQRELDELQKAAVLEGLAAEGVDGLLAMASESKSPWKIGIALARSGAQIDRQATVEKACAHSESGFSLALGYVGTLAETEGGAQIWDLVNSAWGKAQAATLRARFLSCIPFAEDTLQRILTLEDDVQREFWIAFGPVQMIRADADLVEPALGRLLAFGLLESAVASVGWLMHSLSSKVSPEQALQILEAASTSDSMSPEAWGRLAHEVGDILDYLDRSEVDSGRLGRLEFIFSRLLSHTRKPKHLNRLVAEDPSLFILLLRAVFRPRDKTIVEEENAGALPPAMSAYEVLKGLESLPGQTAEGAIDTGQMLQWVLSGRQLAKEAHRMEVFDETLGEWFAGSPLGTDSAFPHEAVREVFQKLESNEFERGFTMGVHNARGVVTKHPDEGGQQERELGDRYKRYADATASRWHRASRALRSISSAYFEEAKREDREQNLE